MNTADRRLRRSARRSLLMTPGDNARYAAGALRSSADAIWLDLEDGVPSARKDIARQNVAAVAQDRGGYAGELLVRVNPISEGGLDEIRAMADHDIDGIVLTKVDAAADVRQAAAVIEELDRPNEFLPRLWAMIETPRSVRDVDEISQCDHLTALVFGAGALAVQLGSHDAAGNDDVLLYSRGRTIVAGRSCGLTVIDGSHPAIDDDEGVERAARRGFSLGFDGKLAPTPRHISAIHRAWAPSRDEIERAEKTLSQAELGDLAAVGEDGRMIVPETVVAYARRILARAAMDDSVPVESDR